MPKSSNKPNYMWWLIYCFVFGYDKFKSISHDFAIMKTTAVISGEVMIKKKHSTSSETKVTIDFVLKSVK